MPNTKSAERRVRNSRRKQLNNQAASSRVRTLEKGYRTLVEDGKKPEAASALRVVVSALDKAVKTGVIHRGTADRKKSRLTVLLASVK